MQPLELVRLAAERLEREGVHNARLEAELLMAHVLGMRRLDVYLQFERPLTPDEVDAFREALRRRVRHEPLQYITGETDFRELTLRVDRRVLIPRPETEVLVGAVLDWAAVDAGEAGGEPTGTGRATALDLGTGSGAIALSLAHEGRFEAIVATDVSADALEVARENAHRLELEDRIELRQGALWDAVGPGEQFRVVVSNPPYVDEADRATLMPEVRDWEPVEALYSSGGGLDAIRSIVAGAPAHVAAGGLLALEVGAGQAEAVAGLVTATGAFGATRVVQDLAGHGRVVLAERKRES